MPTAPNDSDLAAILPGSWLVRSTNSPLWLQGERTPPRITFTLQRERPLTLREEVDYRSRDGADKRMLRVDKWAHGGFVRHGKGRHALRRGRWSIVGANDDSTVLAVRLQKTMFGHAAIEILVREGAAVVELRSLVARNTEQFGLSAEDFASLAWIDPAAPAVPGRVQKAE
jgi:hypothetical protein